MLTQQTHVVRRAGIAATASELEAALMRLRHVEATAPVPQVQWLHSYALCEPDGRFGLACVFEAPDAAALQRHAEHSRLPAHEIVPVAGTLFARAFAPTRVYLVRRRRAWPAGADLDRGGAIVRRMADEGNPRQVSWLHSYVVREDDGSLGSVCLYQGIDPDALGRHAARARMPADEITPVLGRIVYREPSRVAA
jgi:hypothetical protein